eukprot:2806267-Alexandrium_andersonii.AAC.1
MGEPDILCPGLGEGYFALFAHSASSLPLLELGPRPRFEIAVNSSIGGGAYELHTAGEGAANTSDNLLLAWRG